MILITIILSFGYLCLLTWFLIGWLKLKSTSIKNGEPKIRFSIIVPARNEEDNIINTIKDIAEQDYPEELFEVIIIDDDSSDQTYHLALKKIEALKLIYPNFRVLKLTEDEIYTSGHKKRAIEYGIGLALNEWIVTTDADCRRGEHWLS